MALFVLTLCSSALAVEINGITLYGQKPELLLDQPSHAVSIHLSSDKFQLSHQGEVVLSSESSALNSLYAKYLQSEVLKVEQGLSLDKIKQWTLMDFEDFASPVGWSDDRVSRCGINQLLGGYRLFSSGEVYKTFESLPSHSTIKVQLTFHFIDAWTGEMAYLKANLGKNGASVVIWSETYKAGQATNSINVCGGHYGEGQYATHVEISFPHTDSSVKLTFGTTLDQDPGDESWGLSNMQLWIR
mmetsp:Transcript_20763/g.38617  ORF Transcript_20763/g.38617 Transcript_20763/m.38617 type:complete len:244 (-) Transcript_20763:264-995(-)